MLYPKKVGFRKNLLMLAQEPVHLEAVKHLSRPAYKRIKRPYKRKIDKTVAAVLQQQTTKADMKAALLAQFSTAQEAMLRNLKRTETEVKKSPTSEHQRIDQ